MALEQLDRLVEAWTLSHGARIRLMTELLGNEGGLEIFDLASRVLGDPVIAAEWLTAGQLGLGGAVPAVLALSEDGRESVTLYLRQIEYGVYV